MKGIIIHERLGRMRMTDEEIAGVSFRKGGVLVLLGDFRSFLGLSFSGRLFA